MEKETCEGIIKKFSKDGVLCELLIDGFVQEQLFYNNHEIVFKGLEVGDKIILETIHQDNSMTMNVSKKEETKLVATNMTTGVGRSYWKERMLENSFVIDTTQETEESFIEKLKEAKGKKENIVLLAGVDFMTCSPMITQFMQSGLHATVIVEDIHDVQRGIVTPKLDDINLFKRDIDLKLTSVPEPIKPDSKKYDYCQGKQPELSFKSGGNNRKIKKRKKAKNGRGKK